MSLCRLEKETRVSGLSKLKTVLWTVYLTIIICSTAWELFPLPQNSKEYMGIAASFIWCIGLFGYIFQRRIFHRLFWRIWFSLILVATACAFTIFISTMFASVTQIQFLPSGVMLALSFPMYFALYAYAYRSPNVWQN